MLYKTILRHTKTSLHSKPCHYTWNFYNLRPVIQQFVLVLKSVWLRTVKYWTGITTGMPFHCFYHFACDFGWIWWAVFGLMNLLFVPEKIVSAEGKISSRYILRNFNAVYKRRAFMMAVVVYFSINNTVFYLYCI